ncbi:mitochondrial carrier protein [Hirsutella rhossiliensis]|uniref:Mitochondrial carrier protein n=1 Tax=Hirsutella rhossiliensis TaxID=111463 RepID=A0A9P8SER2_9HYPO|nr:mitochondrial carrier protein [Hirsutella rhossiliensis]KAH0960078.1 mitochondrial carrier protein [Hirsutella rhossiliensis]
MSAEFWAGYLSGAVGIVIGNPLDMVKVRLQVARAAAPVLGYGALNGLLFVSYQRTEAALGQAHGDSLWTTWLAGAVGGLCTWVVSTPTELVKCRAQVSEPVVSSWTVARHMWRAGGIRALYFGGSVTALRDSVGYGFYFWSYRLANSWWPLPSSPSLRHKAPRILLCGGLAGIVTWASVFPLDVVKSRVQARPWQAARQCSGALQVAREMFRDEGARAFFRGLTVCSIRAFIVNAVQWAVYESIVHDLCNMPDAR